jgi:hypothetical protein
LPQLDRVYICCHKFTILYCQPRLAQLFEVPGDTTEPGTCISAIYSCDGEECTFKDEVHIGDLCLKLIDVRLIDAVRVHSQILKSDRSSECYSILYGFWQSLWEINAPCIRADGLPEIDCILFCHATPDIAESHVRFIIVNNLDLPAELIDEPQAQHFPLEICCLSAHAIVFFSHRYATIR